MQNRILKQAIIMLVAASAAMNAFAVARGLYIGAAAGPATNGASTQQAQVEGSMTNPPTTVTAKPKSQQFGSRLMVGFMSNEYVGVEAGLDYFSSIRYDTGNVATCSSANARVQDFDVMGKGVFPVKSFNVFGKAGVAFSYQTSSGAFNKTSKRTCGQSTNITKTAPIFTIGAGYDLSQNWVADISLTNVMVGGKIGTMTMFGLGMSYHFVDLYCGQFLC